MFRDSLKIGTVTYEPDGNVPPDFSVAGNVAVEVRRLNQNRELPDGSHQGLEQLAIPFWQRMKKFLPSIGPSLAGECWYVGVRFRRPLEDWNTLRPMMEGELRSFMASRARTAITIKISRNLTLRLQLSGKDHGSFFLLGGATDYDAGGWVMSEVERNLRLCIAEKEKKVAPYRSRYMKWWLVLADHIDYSMAAEDRVVFRSEVMSRIPHSFDRIVLLDPLDHQRAFEI